MVCCYWIKFNPKIAWFLFSAGPFNLQLELLEQLLVFCVNLNYLNGGCVLS